METPITNSMSRIGKKPITIPQGVTTEIRGSHLVVRGPKGELACEIHPHVSIRVDNELGILTVLMESIASARDHALWGTMRNLIANMMKGVTEGFSKQLEVVGIGYKVTLAGKKIMLEVGYSHPVEFPLPVGIEGAVEKNTVTLRGADRALLGETAARLRSIRKPEPYKGKGIKYVDEVIRRKAGKAVKAGGTG